MLKLKVEFELDFENETEINNQELILKCLHAQQDLFAKSMNVRKIETREEEGQVIIEERKIRYDIMTDKWLDSDGLEVF